MSVQHIGLISNGAQVAHLRAEGSDEGMFLSSLIAQSGFRSGENDEVGAKWKYFGATRAGYERKWAACPTRARHLGAFKQKVREISNF